MRALCIKLTLCVARVSGAVPEERKNGCTSAVNSHYHTKCARLQVSAFDLAQPYGVCDDGDVLTTCPSSFACVKQTTGQLAGLSLCLPGDDTSNTSIWGVLQRTCDTSAFALLMEGQDIPKTLSDLSLTYTVFAPSYYAVAALPDGRASGINSSFRDNVRTQHAPACKSLQRLATCESVSGMWMECASNRNVSEFVGAQLPGCMRRLSARKVLLRPAMALQTCTRDHASRDSRSSTFTQ